jgi:hypothetical protein
MNPVQRAYELANSGQFDSFTQVKKAMRRECNVDQALVGRQLAIEITRLCRQSRMARQDQV